MNTMELCNQRKQSEAAGRVLLRSIYLLCMIVRHVILVAIVVMRFVYRVTSATN